VDVQAVRGVSFAGGGGRRIAPAVLPASRSHPSPWKVSMRALPFAALACALAYGSARAETAVDPERAAKGESLYADYCSTCHGFELKNTGGVTFDLRRLRPADHERFVSSVLNGKSQMPPWRGVLDVEQIESIWAFIRATVDR
jgi:mono/diheme cytochrome c family protein